MMRFVKRRDRRRRGGQATVEFALIASPLISLFLGIIAASWEFYQLSAVTDAARQAARQAQVVGLSNSGNLIYQGPSGPLGTNGCEPKEPISIEQSAQDAAPDVRVNQAPLCVPNPHLPVARCLKRRPQGKRTSKSPRITGTSPRLRART